MKCLVRLCLILSVTLAAHVAGAAGSRPNVPAGSYETSAAQMTLPPFEDGLLIIERDCDAGCAPFSFTTTPETSFELGEQRVGLAELKRQLVLHPKSAFLVVLTSDYQHVAVVRMSLPDGGAR